MKSLLVFVPGWRGVKEQWHDVCVLLAAEGHQCNAIDYPKSHAAELSIHELAADLTDVVLRLLHEQSSERPSPLYLVGHSMGARVVVDSAARLSSQVQGVIGVEGLWDVSQNVDPSSIDRIVANFRRNYNSAARKYVEPMFTQRTSSRIHGAVNESVFTLTPTEISQAISLIRSMLGNNGSMRDILQDLCMKKLLINATDWRQTNREVAIQYGFDVKLIPDSGHYVMMERPGAVAEAISEFVTSS